MNSLKSKIFIFFCALLLVVASFILLIVSNTTYQHTQRQIAEQLTSGSSVVQNELESRKRYLGSTVKTVTKNFDLIEQVVSRDTNSIVAALENFRDRAGASFAVVTSPKGTILASTLEDFSLNESLAFGQFDVEHSNTAQSFYALYNNKIYQVFVWPLYAPEPNQIGNFVIGYSLDDNLAKRLKKLTGMDLSILLDDTLLASSLEDTTRNNIDRAPLRFVQNANLTLFKIDATEYVAHTDLLPLFDGKKFTILLQRSLTESLRDYETLKLKLIVGLSLSLLIAALGAFYIAKTVTEPLSQLTEHIKDFSQGKQLELSNLPPSGEVGIVANEFIHMQQQIAEREASILHLAYFDSLTHLANRNEFQRELEISVEKAKILSERVAVFVMDLDNFSDINITLGSYSGDLLLKKIAEGLTELSHKNHLIARLGGDEFAILIPQFASTHDLINWVGHYRQLFNQSFEVDAISLRINATFGVAIYPEHAENSSTLLQRTEVAMYDAKRKKMAYEIYNSAQDHHSILRLALISELKPAIEQNKLELYYQPKLNLQNKSADSAECLVRWIHPKHGFISPTEFIPIAEQTGNIRDLTRWVIETACTQSKKWRDEKNIFITLSINISAVDLLDPDFIDFVKQQLNRYQLNPEALMLEVTESAVMDDPEKSIAHLEDLSNMGIGLSIDDFGTGYSSMAQLKKLPVQELKIDKSFILDLINNQDDHIIVRSTIELAHNMQLSVVAEGVENEQTMIQLEKLNCDQIQGYFLAKPQPAAQFEKWLSETRYNLVRENSARKNTDT